MASTNPNFSIAIIGCGVSGLTLALSLRAHSIPCTIFEMRPAGQTQGGGINLFPNSLRILSSLNAFTSVHAAGFDTINAEMKDAGFKTLKVLPMSDKARYGYSSLRIQRDAIIGTLVEAAVARGVVMEYGHKLVSISETPSSDSVTAIFDNGRDFTTPLLVGADGIWSRVRRTVFPSAPEPSYIGQTAFTWLIPRAELGKAVPEGTQMHRGSNVSMVTPQGMAMFVSDSEDGEVIRVVVMRPLPSSSVDNTGLKALRADKEAILEALRAGVEEEDLPEPVRSAVGLAGREESEMFIWPFYKLSFTSSWVSDAGKGRVLVMGDAAHSFPPTGGQGAGMAIEDAAGLGTVLGLLKERKVGSVEESLSVWERIRKTRLERVGEHVAEVGRTRFAKPSEGGEGKGLPKVEDLGWLYNWKFEDELKV